MGQLLPWHVSSGCCGIRVIIRNRHGVAGLHAHGVSRRMEHGRTHLGLPVLRLALHAGRRGEDIRPAARQGIRHFLVRALAGAVGQPASAASVAYVAQRSVPISCSSPFTFPTPHPSLYIVSGEIGAIHLSWLRNQLDTSDLIL